MSNGNRPASDLNATATTRVDTTHVGAGVDTISVPPMTANLAQDQVPATASDLVEEYGYVSELVYLTRFIPAGYLPHGKEAAPQWIDGFTMMLKEIAMTFEAGRIPTISELEKLEDSKEKKKFYQWYAKEGAGGEEVLKALVRGAKDEWEDEFEDTHCDSEEWDALPTCKKHDFDWSLAEERLVAS